ncbi:MAG: OmpA family protein [Bdellovibrionaceae bacterium]|nr:OmpA family protein [Pseudobdellovibrionaceae bacterium]
MFQRVVLAILSFAFVISCSSKKPEDDAGTNALAGGETTDIKDTPINFDPMGSDGSIPGLNTVNFAYDSSTLSADAKAKLAQNAEWIKANTGVSVQIEGHCDSKGSNEYNLSLGERRANSVKAYLQGLGVDSSRLVTVSYGEERLLDPADTPAADAKNRRANFVPSR